MDALNRLKNLVSPTPRTTTIAQNEQRLTDDQKSANMALLNAWLNEDVVGRANQYEQLMLAVEDGKSKLAVPFESPALEGMTIVQVAPQLHASPPLIHSNAHVDATDLAILHQADMNSRQLQQKARLLNELEARHPAAKFELDIHLAVHESQQQFVHMLMQRDPDLKGLSAEAKEIYEARLDCQ